MALSPDGSRVFVTGKSDGGRTTSDDYATVAYSAASGKRLGVSRYNDPANGAACRVAVSPAGTTVFVTGSAYDSTTGIDYANRCLPRLPALPGSASPRQSARPGKRTVEWPSGGPGQPDPGAIREPGDPGLLAGGNASRQSATRCTGECIKASDSLAGHDPHIEYVGCGWRTTGRSEIISQRNAAQLRGTSAFRCEHGDGHSSSVTLLTGTPWGD